MATFKDSSGRRWLIAINLGAAMTLSKRMGIDLLQPEQGDPPLLTRLGTDELLLGEVICTLLENQFEEHGVTAEEVYAVFDGETTLAAQNAFYEELEDFFRQRGRTDRMKAVRALRKLIEAAIRAADQRVDQIDIDKAIRGITSGDSPESSAATLGR